MSSLTTEHVGATALVRWERPERRNAMDSHLAADLASTLHALVEDETCGVVVLDPDGPVFCSGWDLAELDRVAGRSVEEARAYYATSLALFDVLDELPQLLVSVVRGAALGYGAGLVARSDVVLSSGSAVFGFPEVGVGIVPALAGLDALHALGRRTALAWLATGQQFSAQEALASGLVTRVIDDATMEEEVAMLTDRLSNAPAAVVRRTKAFVRDVTERPATARDQAVAIAVEALSSEEVAARVAAFLRGSRASDERAGA